MWRTERKRMNIALSKKKKRCREGKFCNLVFRNKGVWTVSSGPGGQLKH